MSHVLTYVDTFLFCWHLIKFVVQWCFYLDVSAICASNFVWKSENGVKCWFLFLPDVNFCTGTECSLRPGKFQHPTLPAWSSSLLAGKCQMCQCPKKSCGGQELNVHRDGICASCLALQQRSRIKAWIQQHFWKALPAEKPDCALAKQLMNWSFLWSTGFAKTLSNAQWYSISIIVAFCIFWHQIGNCFK